MEHLESILESSWLRHAADLLREAARELAPRTERARADLAVAEDAAIAGRRKEAKQAAERIRRERLRARRWYDARSVNGPLSGEAAALRESVEAMLRKLDAYAAESDACRRSAYRYRRPPPQQPEPPLLIERMSGRGWGANGNGNGDGHVHNGASTLQRVYASVAEAELQLRLLRQRVGAMKGALASGNHERIGEEAGEVPRLVGVIARIDPSMGEIEHEVAEEFRARLKEVKRQAEACGREAREVQRRMLPLSA